MQLQFSHHVSGYLATSPYVPEHTAHHAVTEVEFVEIKELNRNCAGSPVSSSDALPVAVYDSKQKVSAILGHTGEARF